MGEIEGSRAIAAERARLQLGVIRAVVNARNDADLTQQELADRLGLTKNQVVNMENGRAAIHASELALIATVLGVDFAELWRRILVFKVPRRSNRG